MSLCSVDGCSRNVKYRGWCSMHYHRWYRLGSPGETAPRYPKVVACSDAGCQRKAYAKGLCESHYRRRLPSGRRYRTECESFRYGVLQSEYNGEAEFHPEVKWSTVRLEPAPIKVTDSVNQFRFVRQVTGLSDEEVAAGVGYVLFINPRVNAWAVVNPRVNARPSSQPPSVELMV